MNNVIVCPFCNQDIEAHANWKVRTCDNCKKKLNRCDWKSCAWYSAAIQSAPANDDQLHSKLSETVILGKNNANPVNIEIDLADKIDSKTVAFIHNHKESWFLTADGCCEIYVNGVKIRKHAELSPGDSISALGADMYLTANNEIRAGKCDFGIKNLILKNISAKLGSKKLSISEININAGEFVGILGPSGCGKSSLLEIMVGLRRDARGEYLINGNDSQDEFSHINFAYVPQDIVLHKDLTLAQEISCFKQINIHENVSREYVDRLLRRIDLESQKNNATGNLSGGQRRRAGIMMELLQDPAILFLDEPTAGLDPKFEAIVMKDLKALSQQGRIVICSTHIMNSIGLFDKVIFLNKNAQLEFFGTPAELLKKYKVNEPVELYDIEPGDTACAENVSQKKINGRFDFNFRHWGISWREVSGYLKRTFWEITKFDLKKFLKSPLNSPLAILFIQPVLIALVLNLSCAAKLFNVEKELGFFFALAVFWLGMNNSIREFVKERIPFRCLERLRSVRLGSYISSKILWMIAICTVQVVLFFGTLCIWRAPILKEVINPEHAQAYLSLDIACILLLVCITGGFIGLAISSFNEKENTAICFLPIVIIPVLFFSSPIIRNTKYELGVLGDSEKGKFIDSESGDYNKIAVMIERVMPCYGPQLAIQKIAEANQQQMIDEAERKKAEANQQRMIYEGRRNTSADDKSVARINEFTVNQQLLYIIVCFAIMCLSQNQKEKEWGGR